MFLLVLAKASARNEANLKGAILCATSSRSRLK